MEKIPRGKLKMVPIWVFDLAFGGYPESDAASEWVNDPNGFV